MTKMIFGALAVIAILAAGAPTVHAQQKQKPGTQGCVKHEVCLARCLKAQGRNCHHFCHSRPQC